VEADFDGVVAELSTELPVHLLDDVRLLDAASDVRLIGHDDDSKASRSEGGECLADAGKDPELVETGGGIRSTVANDRLIDDTVAVQQDGPRTARHCGGVATGESTLQNLTPPKNRLRALS
jgi:hypothetical protein